MVSALGSLLEIALGILILALNSEKKHLEIAITDKFQLDLKTNDRDIGNRILIWCLSNRCTENNQEKNTEVCMASFCLQMVVFQSNLTTLIYSCQCKPILRCTFTPCCQNMKFLKVYFYDVITDELFVERS